MILPLLVGYFAFITFYPFAHTHHGLPFALRPCGLIHHGYYPSPRFVALRCCSVVTFFARTRLVPVIVCCLLLLRLIYLVPGSSCLITQFVYFIYFIRCSFVRFVVVAFVALRSLVYCTFTFTFGYGLVICYLLHSLVPSSFLLCGLLLLLTVDRQVSLVVLLSWLVWFARRRRRGGCGDECLPIVVAWLYFW